MQNGKIPYFMGDDNLKIVFGPCQSMVVLVNCDKVLKSLAYIRYL